MAIYDKNGNQLSACYDASGNALTYAYDKNGNAIFTAGHIDPTPSSDLEEVILTAKNLWKAEYEANSSIIPMIVTADPHGTLSGTYAKGIFEFLGDAVEWDNISCSLNLGDVCTSAYNTAHLNDMQTCFSSVPDVKQINVIGNHDVWSSEWTSDDTAVPSEALWASLQSYFDNSAYNGYHFMAGTNVNQYMIDEAHGVRYVCAGAWDFDRSLGGHSCYVIDSDNMDSIIQMLSIVDDYDIIWLSHNQPIINNSTYVNYWTDLYNDGNTAGVQDGNPPDSFSNRLYANIHQMLFDRKNKRSGTVNDSYGNSHSYDFTRCTSDLICCLAGHAHVHWYGVFDNLNVTTFDAMHYDTQPFYFVNIDRTNNKMVTYRVDNTPQYVRREIPLTEG